MGSRLGQRLAALVSNVLRFAIVGKGDWRCVCGTSNDFDARTADAVNGREI